jgi:hypothetical protein
MYLGYPIKTSNGSKWNPFFVKAQTNEPIVDLKNGQSTQFIFNAPVKEVFGNSKLLDFTNPEFELEGYTKEGNKEIPFEVSGNLGVFINGNQS